jgi:hypothetical protein
VPLAAKPDQADELLAEPLSINSIDAFASKLPG